MREDLVHYLWRYKKFDEAPLRTTTPEMVYVLDNGPKFSYGTDSDRPLCVSQTQIPIGTPCGNITHF